MTVSAALISSVQAFRPFLPAKDFEVSKRFYAALGFEVHSLGDKIAEVRLERYSFLLQHYYVQQWAENFMMHILVDDVQAWWSHIETLDLTSSFPVRAPIAPKLQDWGLIVAYVFDPAGVLWHFAEVPQRDRSAQAS